MHRTWIAIVDATRARLFAYDRSSEIGEVTEQLTEHRALINPARRRRPSELFSDTRPGSARVGGVQYAFDDHRRAHLDRMDDDFARVVVHELAELLRGPSPQRVIICASPRILGRLRKGAAELPRDATIVDEIPRDLVKLTPVQLRDRLASYGLLPSRAGVA